MKSNTSRDDTLRLKRALVALKDIRAKLDAVKYTRTEPIAVIGLGCRFPGADNPEAFWQLLRNGEDAIREVPARAWDIDDYYDPDPHASGKMYTRYGGFLDQVDHFDAAFWGISPREAAKLDPQQRLLLEVSWEALEDAAVNPEQLVDSPTGVFIGISHSDYVNYLNSQGQTEADLYMVTGNDSSTATGRLSYLFGLQGPNLAVNTACSSSLVALHLAVTSLRNRECNLALAGGVNLLLTPNGTIAFCRAGALAVDGRCKTFDERADGYVRSEGCGIVVLKRLSDAESDGDNILALIRGSAINQDGRTNGLTAPNEFAQQAVIQKALSNARVKPSEVSYVETHGTGTSLGDPIEVNALGTVFYERERENPLIMGAVKSNIGHLEMAAGIAGFIKVVLALQQGEIPANLHFSAPNPHIPWDDLPVMVATELTPWPTDKRLAGVSSFGFSGTNAHLVLEAASHRTQAKMDQDKETTERPLHLLTLSAKNREGLQELAEGYIEYLESQPQVSLADICFTANTGRVHFHHRLAVVATDTSQAREKLTAFRAGKPAKGLASGRMQRSKRLQIAFLFTGQGSQYVNMGRQLYETEAIFRQVLDQCNEIWQNQSLLPIPLLEVLYPASTDNINASLIDQTAYTQTALFAIEYALAELWKSWGVEPDFVMGHSAGEYAAACFAGIMSLEDGLKLSAARGRLMETTKVESATAAVFANAEQVREIIAPYAQTVGLAGLNAPEETLIAGVAADVEAVLANLKEAGIGFRPVQVSQASHSPLMEPILDEFEQIARTIDYFPPRVNLVSNVTGDLIDNVDATYWRRHMREPVQFMSGMKKIEEAGCDIILEIGPQPVLLWLGRQNWNGSDDTLWLSSLWGIRDDWEQLLQSAAQAYVRGVQINWTNFDRQRIRRKVVLPTYPWQRQRYWIKENELTTLSNNNNPGARSFDKKESQLMSSQELSNQPMPKEEWLLQDLRTQLAEIFELDASAIETDATFVEMGADSLLLGRVTQAVEKRYGVKLGIHQLFDEFDSPDTLLAHLSEQLPAEWRINAKATEEVVPETPVESVQEKAVSLSAAIQPAIPTQSTHQQNAPAIGESASALERVINKQLDFMNQQFQSMSQMMAKQLELLGGKGTSRKEPIANGDLRAAAQPPLHKASLPVKKEDRPANPMPARGGRTLAPRKARKLFPNQQAHLDALIRRYSEHTTASKQRAQAYRGKLADTRSMRLFRTETKEMVYPIVGQRADGARFWDIDDNEYVDIAMGIGTHLCGHHPPFIAKAVQEQLQHAVQTGPVANLGGEVADLICDLTGMERVLFGVTGTGAVKGALRLARTVTGRDKFVMFQNAYHGQSDDTLVIPDINGDPLQSTPMVPGIPLQHVENVIILPYDEDKSLEIIKKHAHELAAVLVEPVQSRSPGLQPKAFLKELRQLTSDTNVPLIFDEVITGFRVHPGGAQAWFGVEADLVTYGKAVGGGMPVSVIAGKATYLDRVDGGMWSYGDASYPQLETTFIGSTFEMHPLAMATSRALLQHLKQEGPALQQRLNQRTEQLVDTLNGLFEQEEVPIKVTNFGSLFRFAWKNNLSYVFQPLEIDLFYYHLALKGVYIWEGRTCFLSTAHTDEDIAHIVKAVEETIAEMKKGGFLSARQTRKAARGKKSPLEHVPLSEGQKELWKLARKGELDWRNSVNILLRGPFHKDAMQRAVQQVVNRHEALRTTISRTEPVQITRRDPTASSALERIDLTHLTGQAQEEAVTEWLSQETKTPFDLFEGPLMRTHLLKLKEELHLLAIGVHHIISDGWSIDIILSELTALYAAACGCQGIKSQLEVPHQYREFISWQTEQSQMRAAQETYWLDQFRAGLPVAHLPTDYPRSNDVSHRGDRYSARFDAKFTRQIKQLGRAHKSTLFMTLLSGYGLLLHRLTGQDELVIGTPTAGRASFEHRETVVGYCPHFLPIRSRLVGNPTIAEYLMTLKKTILAAYKHQDYPFARLLNKLKEQKEPCPEALRIAPYPVITTLFNLDRSIPAPDLYELQTEFYPAPANFALVDFRLDVIEINGELWLDYDYRTELFEVSTIERWHNYFQTLLEEIIANPQQHVLDFRFSRSVLEAAHRF